MARKPSKPPVLTPDERHELLAGMTAMECRLALSALAAADPQAFDVVAAAVQSDRARAHRDRRAQHDQSPAPYL